MIWRLQITYYERRLNEYGSTISSKYRGSMLGGSEENKYPYSDFDAPKILDKRLKKGLIRPKELMHHEEIRRTIEPKYCKYHRIYSVFN